MHHVFISYSRADLAAVDQIAAGLEAGGVRLWIDRRDIPVSVPWWEEVTTGIEAADLFVVCDSANWRSSQACQLEYEAAQAAHKHLLIVDLQAEPPMRIVARIAAAVRAIPPVIWVHTEAGVRTAMWQRGGRRPAALARGNLLRQMRSLARKGQPPLPGPAHEFVRASRVRARRRRVTAWVSGTVAVAALLLCGMGAMLRSFATDQIRGYNANLGSIGAADGRAAQDPYEALATERDRIRGRQTGYVDRVLTVRALATPVPDNSYLVPGRRLVGFTSRVTGDDAVVMDDQGSTYRGAAVARTQPESAAAQPLQSLTTATDGATTVRRTATNVTVQIGDRTAATLPATALAAVSADGTQLLTLVDMQLKVSAPGGTAARTVAAPAQCCTALALAGPVAVLGGATGAVSVWRAGAELSRVWSRPPGGPVQRITSTADGSAVAVSLRDDGLVHVLRTTDFSEVGSLIAGRSQPMEFSPNGRLLAVGVGARVVVFDRGSGTALTTLTGSAGEVRDVSWSADSSRVFAVAGENRVVAWPVRRGRSLLDDRAQWFVAVTRPAPDGRMVAVDRGGDLLIIAPDAKTIVATVPTSARDVYGATISPDGTAVALAALAPTVVIRPLSTGSEHRIDTGCDAVRVAWSPNGRRLYTTCANGEVRLFDASDGHKLASARVEGGGQPVAIAVDARGEVFVGDAYGETRVFDAELRRQSRLVEATCGLPLRAVAVSDGGEKVVTSGDGVLHLGCMYEVHRSGSGWKRVLHQQPMETGEQGRAVDITGDGRLAVIGLSDGRVRMWRSDETLNPVGAYRETGGEVWGAAFTRDGSQVVVGTRDGMLTVVPSCEWCGSDTALADEADRILARARGFGLTDR